MSKKRNVKQSSKPALPPDEEGENDNRASWAEDALAAFRANTNADPEDALSDLLCDLMHWADRNGADFNVQLHRGRVHYSEETADANGKAGRCTECGRQCEGEGVCPYCSAVETFVGHGNDDLYTDAEEYEERVGELQNACIMLSRMLALDRAARRAEIDAR